MRLGFLRQNNTDLPLFNSRRSGSRSPSPHRKPLLKKHVFIGLLVLLALILLFRPSGSSKIQVFPLRDIYLNFDRRESRILDLINTSRLGRIYSMIVCIISSQWLPYVPTWTQTTHFGRSQHGGTLHWGWIRTLT